MFAPSFLNNRNLRLLLFGGKGGVGKTTCATAAAISLASKYPQESFLLVSTDPAHSLADSLAGSRPPPNLKVLELNAQEYLDAFKEKHNRKLHEIAARGTFLDEDDVNRLLGLSLPGMDEIVSFLEISGWVEDKRYGCIIVDTAPSGHTIRLLEMPDIIRKWLEALDALLAKHRYMKKLFSGAYRRDELDHFLETLAFTVKQVQSLLKDQVRCLFVPVTIAEKLSIRETAALVDEINRIKLPVTDIIVNKLYPANSCQFCIEEHARQMRDLYNISSFKALSGCTLWGVPLFAIEVRGMERLEAFWRSIGNLTGIFPIPRLVPAESTIRVEAATFHPSTDAKLLLFAGKGGVGKTTMACATAIRLARDFRDKELLLFSTDPSHSLSSCFDVEIGPEPKRLSPGLSAMEIDAKAEFDALKRLYQEELELFLSTLLPNLDLTFDRAVMEKILDLSPPGLDEVMALTRMMEFLAEGRYDFIILDTAPTGHLIRFLELPELINQWLKVFFELFLKYKNIFVFPCISERLVKISKNLKQLRSILGDSTRSQLYVVTILTEMAFAETKDLMAACWRLGINTPVMFLNLATPVSDCDLCSQLNRKESIMNSLYRQTFRCMHQTLIYRQGEPRGLRQLSKLGEALYLQAGQNLFKKVIPEGGHVNTLPPLAYQCQEERGTH
jgi:arsenite-transporting ATPase